MLLRIEKISGRGVWDGFTWDQNLPDFARLNVIYGANGSGKSSLTSMLAHAVQDPDASTGFTLTVADPSVRQVSGGNRDPFFERLYVFGDDFVERSHRFRDGNPNIDAVLTLGERAASAEDRLRDLHQEHEDLTKQLKESQDSAKAARREADKALERISVAVVSDLSSVPGYQSRTKYNVGTVKQRLSQLQETSKALSDEDLTSRKTLVSSAQRETLPVPALTILVPSELRLRAESLLATTPVSVILDSLRSNPKASSWVQEGLPLHEHVADCLFCGQSLPNDRISEIERHFNDEVTNTQKSIDSTIEEIREIISSAQRRKQSISADGLLSDSLRNEYSSAKKLWQDQASATIQYLNALISRLAAKRETPIDSVDSRIDEPPSCNGEPLERILENHNTQVANHADLINKAAQEVEQHYLATLGKDAETYTKREQEATQKADHIAATLREIQQEIRKLEQVEGDPTPSAQVLTREIGRLLGRDELKFEAREGKYAVTRLDEPATNLSAGERTAITLVHFLETVRCHDAAKGAPIIVVDDPISSLDSNIFLGISTYLWKAAMNDAIQQVIILTHSFDFYKQWDTWIQGLHRARDMKAAFPAQQYEIRSTHKTVKSQVRRRATVTKWPDREKVRHKVRSSYHHAFISLADALSNLQADNSLENRLDAQLLFPNVARRMLETFLAFKLPDKVGNFTEAMRSAGEILRDSTFDGDVDALRHLLTRYTHAYSHQESPETHRAINPDETERAIGSAFEFMKAIDPEHFNGLCQLLGRDPAKLLRSSNLGATP